MIGEKIKACREYRGWTQKKLAEKAGISPNVLGRYERGQSIPSYLYAEELLAVMGFKLVIKPMTKEERLMRRR